MIHPKKSRDFIFQNLGMGKWVQSRDPGISRDPAGAWWWWRWCYRSWWRWWWRWWWFCWWWWSPSDGGDGDSGDGGNGSSGWVSDLEFAAELFLEQLRSFAARKLRCHFNFIPKIRNGSIFRTLPLSTIMINLKSITTGVGTLPLPWSSQPPSSTSNTSPREVVIPGSAPKIFVETASSLNGWAECPRVEQRWVLIIITIIVIILENPLKRCALL